MSSKESAFAMETNNMSRHFMGFMVSAPWEEVLIFQVMKCYINPILSLLGLAANAFSVSLLRRSGLRKPSNVLLLGLTISDSMCMLLTLDIPDALTYFDPQKKYPLLNGWQYEYGLAYFLYLLFSALESIGCWGCYVNSAIPVLITMERLCAIFWPMTFKRFITTRFAVAGVTLAFTFWLPINVIFQVNMPFKYVNLSETVSMGTWSFTEYFNDDAYFIPLYLFEVLSSWVPIAIVSFGCFAIWIKLKAALSNRRALTNSNIQWSPKTTRTLLATCLIFSITHIAYSVIVYIYRLDFVNTNDYFNQYVFISFIYIVNNSSNFFIYIAFNQKFRVIFQDVFKKPRFR